MNHLATAERLHALYMTCLLADLDYETTGSVSAETIEQMRKVMSEVQSSTQKNVAPTERDTKGEIGRFHQVPAAIDCTGACANAVKCSLAVNNPPPLVRT